MGPWFEGLEEHVFKAVSLLNDDHVVNDIKVGYQVIKPIIKPAEMMLGLLLVHNLVDSLLTTQLHHHNLAVNLFPVHVKRFLLDIISHLYHHPEAGSFLAAPCL